MGLFSKEKTSIKDALVLNAISPSIAVNRLHLELDEDLCRILVFTKYKKSVDVGWCDFLYKQTNMPVSILLEPMNTGDLLDGIDQSQKQLEGMLGSNKRLRASQVNQIEREIRHGEEIMNLVGDEGETFFATTFIAVLRARDLEELNNKEKYFKSIAGSAGMKFMAIANDQLQSWLAASPLRIKDAYVEQFGAHPMPTKTIGYAKPAVALGLDDGVGIALGSDDYNGQIRLNIIETSSSRLNRNILIFGGSGSGKTALTKKIVGREYLQFGTRIIIIDHEGDFVPMAHNLNGDVIKLGSSSAAKLSPLQPRAVLIQDSDDGTESIDSDDPNGSEELVLLSTIPFVKSWFMRAFKIPDYLMSSFELALEKTYEQYGITKDTTFAQYQRENLSYPVMSDIYNTLNQLKESDPEHREAYSSLAQYMRTLSVGIQSSLWNSRTTLKLNSDFVVLDTSDIQTNELMEAQYYNILSWIWSEIRLNPHSDHNIRVVIDEAAIIVNERNREAAEMVRNMVKRIRKRKGGTLITTQEPNDFLAKEVKNFGAAICNNATYKFIGNAEAENLDRVIDIYHIDNDLRKRLEHANRGEFALFAGVSNRTWANIELADWEYDLFSIPRDNEQTGKI